MTMADNSIAERFAALADPRRVGLCFAITRKAFADGCEGREDNIPRPVYPHALIKDRITDNYIVLRLAKEGDDWRAHLMPILSQDHRHAVTAWVEVIR